MKYIKTFEQFINESNLNEGSSKNKMIDYIINSEDEIESGLLDAIYTQIDSDNLKKGLSKLSDKEVASIYKDVMDSLN